LVDTSGDGVLQFEEFQKAISDFQLYLSDVDVRNAFKAFDVNNNGVLEYDEFIKVLIGPMPSVRRQVVEKAFEHLDVNRVGLIDIDYCKRHYDASRHIEALRGKRTPEELKAEFEETFDQHHSLI